MNSDHKHGEMSKQRKNYPRTGICQNAQSTVLIKKRVEQFVKREGRRPRILISSMGKKNHDQETKLLASILAETGFDVDISPPRQTPPKTARMAVENDVHVVCFLSTENVHKELATDLSEALNAENRKDIRIVIGGAIPESDYDFLYSSGVGLILNSGPADTVAINRLLDLIE